jgi:hypothetical protein
VSETYTSRVDLAAKVDWEGGIFGALEYGITSDMMPDEELREYWADLERRYAEMQETLTALIDIFEEVTP